MRAAVAANVHQPAQGEGVTVSLSIRGAVGSYSGELVVVDRNGRRGRRELSAATCDEVAHALAFMAGLAIDLGGHVDDEPPAPPTKPPPSPPPAPPPAPPPRPLLVSLALTGGLRGGLGTGEVFVNGQFEPTNRPKPVARAFVNVSPHPDPTMDWYLSFNPDKPWPAMSEIIHDGNGNVVLRDEKMSLPPRSTTST